MTERAPQASSKLSNRWFVVMVFLFFMLLHQSDRLLITSLTKPIMETFQISMTQMGAVQTGALIVAAVFYPLWGYLYDRYARAKLLALASFLWGATTWLGAIAPTYPTFLVARSTTGIDDSSYPGLYSLMSDYFVPTMRGKIYGLLELTMPLGYLVGMFLGLMFGGVIGWRNLFYITGALGIALAFVIFFGVREAPRGRSEPEMADIPQISAYRFDWKIAKDLFTKRSLRLLFLQGFFGVFPWNTITYWFIYYLQTERGYSDSTVMSTMVVVVLVLAAGYPLGGALGDYFFKRTPRGRVLVATTGVLVGALLMIITLNIPPENQALFTFMLALNAIFIPLSAPNVISTVYDITLPEVRSTAMSIQSFIESIGAALAPLLAGYIADQFSLQTAFLAICVTAWLICAIFYAFIGIFIPKDIEVLRSQMRLRAEQEKLIHAQDAG
jgi:MFS family permease